MEEMDINQLAVIAKNGDMRAFEELMNRMEGAVNAIVGNYAVGCYIFFELNLLSILRPFARWVVGKRATRLFPCR